MLTGFVLTMSVLLQFATAFMAARLIKVTGNHIPWGLISLAISLMAVRRSISLLEFVSGGNRSPLDLSFELVGLITSALMLLGVILISPLLRSMTDEIARRKQAEEDRLVSEKKFRDLLEAVQLVAVILDRDGKITFCNNYLLGLTGWSRDEVLNKDWFDLFIPEEVREAVKSVFQKIIDEGTMLHYENPITTRDGTQRLIVWDNAFLHDIEGRVTGTASIGIDVTEHRKLEEQLLQSQKLEAIGRLSGGVAHDFNNILSAIVGYAHLTLMKLPEDDPLRGNLEQILQASDRAATLTQSLLSFSRKRVINLQPNDLNDIVKRSRKFLSRLIREDIEIAMTCVEGDLTVLADSTQIEQVLMNLVTNARDAMPGGGRITIQTVPVQMDERFVETHGYGKAGNYALLLVSDTGEGMDAKTRERIFEPFFTTKEQGKGTGLGLSMVYGIVKQHQGFIDVYTEPGRGTTVKIYLPLLRGVDKEERREAGPAPLRGGSELILVAEDDSSLRRLASAILRNYGYRVIEAVDGEDAVAKYRENRDAVRLVILDGIMPRKNGREAYQEIRDINPSVRAIFVSGYAEDIVSREGLLEPGINFILKPVTPSDLLKKVRELLDS